MAILDELKALGDFGDMSDVQLITTLHERYAPQMPINEFADKFGVKLPTRPSPLFSLVPNAIESGFRGAQQGTNLALNALGLQGDKETAERVSELERRKGEIAPQGSVADGLKAIQDASKEGWGAAVKAIASNPQVLPRLIGESIGSFLPDIALAAATGGVAGPVAKAAALRLGVKSIAPEAIAAAAKVASAAGVAGVGSAKTEFGAEILETFQEAGIDISSSSAFKAGLEDPELLARAQKAGLQKGIPVGLFDALSMGVAGRILDPALEAARLAGKPIAKTTMLGRGAAELGVQAGLGAAGEATGQLVQKGRIDNPADVILEAVAELGTGPVEALTNIRTARKQREEAALRQEEEKAAALEADMPRQQRLEEERRIAEKSADIGLLEDSSRPAPQERVTPEVDWLGRPVEAPVEPELKIALAQAAGLQGEDFRKLRDLPSAKFRQLAESALQTDPTLADKIPALVPWLQGNAERNPGVDAFQQGKPLALPPPQQGPPAKPTPTAYETPLGQITPEQADKLITKYQNTPEVQAVVNADLSPVEKRQQALSAIFNADIQQVQTGETKTVLGPAGEDGFQYPSTQTTQADLDRVSAQGQVVPAEALRQQEHLKRLAVAAKVEPSVATQAYDVYKKAKEASPELRVPAFQQAYKATTGQALPLKPASVLFKAFDQPNRLGPAQQGPQLWGAPQGPTSIPPEMWSRVLSDVRQMPKGKPVTVPQLRGLGLSLQQAQDARDALRKGNVMQGIDDARTGQPVPFSNTLSPTNALNFLSNEFNGKNYGCM